MKLLLKIFKTVSDSKRLGIIELLLARDMISIDTVVKKLKITSSTTCFHLKKLENVGIIVSYKKGKKVYYSLNKKSKHYRFNRLLLKMIKIQRTRYENNSN